MKIYYKISFFKELAKYGKNMVLSLKCSFCVKSFERFKDEMIISLLIFINILECYLFHNFIDKGFLCIFLRYFYSSFWA